MLPPTIPCACLVALCAWSSVGLAGSRPYGFTQGTESLQSAELELESWFTAVNPRGAGIDNLRWDWWLGPVVGLSDHFEAGLFAIFDQPPAPAGLALSELRLQLSWSPVERMAWPVDVRFRGEVGAPMSFTPDGGSYSLWALAMIGKDLGALNLTANVGGWLRAGKKEEPDGDVETTWYRYLNYSAAASYALTAALRVGGEAFGDFRTDTPARGHWAGPTLAYGTGRLWMSMSFLFALTDDTQVWSKDMGRIVVGLLF